MDTAGYLHVNNQNTLNRMIPLCDMTNIWRQKKSQTRQYTFHKRQTKNYTRARLDYFLQNESSTHLVKRVGIGKVCTLSDHRPIFLHITLSKTQRGRGFWRFNNDLLTDPRFIFGCNNVIKKQLFLTLSTNIVEPQNTHLTMRSHQSHLKFLAHFCTM